MAKSPFAQVAHQYLALGFAPLPRLVFTLPNGKKKAQPAVKGWSQFCSEAPQTDQINEWARSFRGADLMLATGLGGFVVIDVDTNEDGPQLAVLNTLKQCRVARFGSKGFALLARHQSGAPVKSRAVYSGEGAARRPMVEILSDGRNITVPPSIHAGTGNAYIWFDPETGETWEHRPSLRKLPEVSDADLDRLIEALKPWASKPREPAVLSPAQARRIEAGNKRLEHYAKAQLQGAAKELSEMGADSGRNAALNIAAFKLGWALVPPYRVLTEYEIERALLTACEQNGLARDDGDRAVLATIQSGMVAGRQLCEPPELQDRLPAPRRRQERAQGRLAAPEAVAAPRVAQGGGGAALPPLDAVPAVQEPEPNGNGHGGGGNGYGGGANGGGNGAGQPGGMPPEPPDQWERDENGKLLKNRHNLVLALETSGVDLAYDEFALKNHVAGLEGHGPHLDDPAMRALFLLVWEEYGLKYAREDFDVIIRDKCYRHRFHPVRQYLDGLIWDGIERIDEWLHAYGGAENSELNRAIGRMFLIAAVRRVREPGCKFDEMLVLQGSEGVDKSTALKVLASEAWFVDSVPFGADRRVVIEQLAGCWIAESAELDGMKRTEITKLKAFLSASFDEAAMKYEREKTRRPRQCVITGTTNEEHFLLSNTGNRRWLPVAVKKFDIESLKRDRDQLWAEAAFHEKEGASIRLPPELYEAARQAQEARRVTDPWLDFLRDALGDLTGKVAASELWKFLDRQEPKRRTQGDNIRLGAAMRELGWRRPAGGIWAHGRPVTGYVKGDSTYALLELDGGHMRFEVVKIGDDDEGNNNSGSSGNDRPF